MICRITELRDQIRQMSDGHLMRFDHLRRGSLGIRRPFGQHHEPQDTALILRTMLPKVRRGKQIPISRVCIREFSVTPKLDDVLDGLNQFILVRHQPHDTQLPRVWGGRVLEVVS
jgi:hypothetical protein